MANGTKESWVRGISVRPDVGFSDEKPPRIDQPQEFRPITIKNLEEVADLLVKNGLTYRIVNLRDKPVQLLIYRISEVKEAKRLSGLAHGSPLRQFIPAGIVWDESTGQYLATPVVWTNALTEEVFLTQLDEAVWLRTTDRKETGGRIETRVLFQNNVYTEEAWRRANQASQLAQEGLTAPPGSPASTVKPESIQWSNQFTGSFRPDGLYSSPPGTRYGFTGWVRPKKLI